MGRIKCIQTYHYLIEIEKLFLKTLNTNISVLKKKINRSSTSVGRLLIYLIISFDHFIYLLD